LFYSECAIHGDGGRTGAPKLDLVTPSGRTYVLVFPSDDAGRADERDWWCALVAAQHRQREEAAAAGGLDLADLEVHR